MSYPATYRTDTNKTSWASIELPPNQQIFSKKFLSVVNGNVSWTDSLYDQPLNTTDSPTFVNLTLNNLDSNFVSLKSGIFKAVIYAGTLGGSRGFILPDRTGVLAIGDQTLNPNSTPEFAGVNIKAQTGPYKGSLIMVGGGASDVNISLPNVGGTLALASQVPAIGSTLTDTLDTTIPNNSIVVGSGVGLVVKSSGFSTNQNLNTSSDVSFNSANIITGQSYKINSTSVLKTGSNNTAGSTYVSASSGLGIAGTEINNTAIGYETLKVYSNSGQLCDNTACGTQSLLKSTTGIKNTAIGSASLYNIIIGGGNSCIGYKSGFNYTSSESNNICIGNDVMGVLGENNKVNIGNSSNTDNYFFGNMDIKNSGDKYKIAGIEKLSATALNSNLTFPTAAGTTGEILAYTPQIDPKRENQVIVWDGTKYQNQDMCTPMAEIAYNNATGTAIALTIQNTTYEINPVCTLLGNNSFFTANQFDISGNGQIRYIGVEHQYFHIAVSLSASVSAAADSYYLDFHKTSATIPNSGYYIDFPANNTKQTFAAHKIIELDTNDFISIHAANLSAAGKTMTIHSFNVQLVACCPIRSPSH